MKKKYVLITGASSGIGKATAEMLAKSGFIVFAGVRKEHDAAQLEQENIIPVYIDINSDEQVNSVYTQIEQIVQENGLYGLVNNAGIAIAGPMEFLPLEKLRLQLETNVIGQVRAIQTFLPLIRKNKGRIINISSIAGFSAFPFKGAYCASKHAIEAVSDCLRRELSIWNIPVSIIAPGIIKTSIWERSLGLFLETLCEMNPNAQKYYGNYCDPLIEKMKKKVEKLAISPEEVAKMIYKALNDKKPRSRYLVGKDAKILNLIKFLPDRVKDKLLCSNLKINNEQS